MAATEGTLQRQAVHGIYREHQGWLLAWLRRRLRCPCDAADLSHDTFLRLLSGGESVQLREPRAYLLVIANRLLINRYRRNKVEEEALRHVTIVLEQWERRGPAEAAAAQDLLAQVLILVTEELSENQRKTLFMARIGGLSYKTIARRLSVSESSVKQYLIKALAHCHARLYDSLA